MLYEVALGTDGKLQYSGSGTQKVDCGINAVAEVSLSPVHSFFEAHAQDVLFFSLAPDSLGLRIHSCNSMKDSDSPIKDMEGTLDFQGKINVTKGVGGVDPMVPSW